MSLQIKELVAELGLLTLRASKNEAISKEGASAARDEEARVLREHQVGFVTSGIERVPETKRGERGKGQIYFGCRKKSRARTYGNVNTKGR